MGRNGGHQRGVSMAAYGELSMATVRWLKVAAGRWQRQAGGRGSRPGAEHADPQSTHSVGRGHAARLVRLQRGCRGSPLRGHTQRREDRNNEHNNTKTRSLPLPPSGCGQKKGWPIQQPSSQLGSWPVRSLVSRRGSGSDGEKAGRRGCAR
jgi:hypothetical protein